MQRIFIFAPLFAAFIICSGCQTQCVKVRAMDVTDGVSRPEAMTIARCYSDRHLGSGKISAIVDGGDDWTAVGSLGGYLAKPFGFTISKQTGKITGTAGPSYATPFALVDASDKSRARTRDR